MRVYWVERIDFWAGLHLLACQFHYRAPAQLICYEPPTDYSLWRSLLRIVGIVRIEMMASALGDMINERGINLYWHNDELMLAATERSLARLDIEHLARLTGESPDILRVFFTRAAMADLHQQTLRATALWGNSRDVASDDQYLLLPNSLFFNALADSYRRPGLSVAHYWRPFQATRLIREYLAATKHLLRACVADRQAGAPPRPVVAVQYVAGLDRSRVNDIPWLDASGLRPDQILVYAEGARVPDAAVGARALGFRFVDLQRWQPAKEHNRFVSDVVRAMATSLRLVFTTSGRRSQRLWLSFWIVRFLRSEARWRAFFAEHNIKIHLHVGDADALALAATAALNKLEGLDFAFQLGGSCIELAFEHRALTNRILFAWGDYYRRMNNKVGGRIAGKEPYKIIVSGHQHDYLIATYRDKAKAFRALLHKRGVNFVIVGFDNVARRDLMISPSHLASFYTSLIDIASSDNFIAVVVKPKGGSNIVLPQKYLQQLHELKADGRWIEMPAQASVFEAALCGDVVVALHMSTAAMEAAVAGVPHIYYALTAWGDHPFYSLRRKLIATNREELRQLVAGHRKGEGFNSRDPEFEHYRKELSRFDDHQSAIRMGNAVESAFKALVAGEAAADVVKWLEGDLPSRPNLGRVRRKRPARPTA